MGNLDDMFDEGKLRLTVGHLIAAFVVTKEAARRVNEVLASKLSRETWAVMSVKDYAATSQQPRNSRQWRKGLIGFARFNYLGSLNLTEAELRDASESLGLWTSPSW